MGAATSTQNLDDNKREMVISRFQFLEYEKMQISLQPFNNHLRKIDKYNFVENNGQQNFVIKTDNINTITLQAFIKQKIQVQIELDYWKIFSEMLLGIYQLHQADLLGRCLVLDKIYIKQEQICFYQLGYFHRQSYTPEFTKQKLPTYETDLWLIGSIMYEILTGKKIYEYYYQKQNRIIDWDDQFGENLNILFDEEQNAHVFKDFKNILKKILVPYSFYQITLVELFSNQKILTYVPKQYQNQIQNFYSEYQIKSLILQWKISKKRDCQNQKIYFYSIDSELIKYFYQFYVEILLLNFIYCFSYHFPCSDYKQINEIKDIIIIKMWIISKKLKLMIQQNDFPLQFSGVLECYENYVFLLQNLKKEIEQQHSLLFKLRKKYLKKDNLPQTIYQLGKVISNIKFEQSKTLTQKLCVNILQNSKVKDLTEEELLSYNMEQIFENELRLRI